MHKQSSSRIMAIAALVIAAVVLAPAAMANAETASKKASVEQTWNDFIYYITVAQPNIAKSYGQALLDDSVDAGELYKLSIKTEGLDKAMAQATSIPELSEVAAELLLKLEAGYKLDARSPANIAQSLELLAGHAGQMATARQRLQISGEFAVPQMIKALESSQTSDLLRDRISETLAMLGSDGVRPLCEALNSRDPYVRETVCTALGRIGYKHAAAALRAVMDNTDEIDAVRQAASLAFSRVAPGEMNKSLAGLYYNIGLSYYSGDKSVLPMRQYSVANIWQWRPSLGLTYVEVPSEIFLDVYAMQCASRALDADRGFSSAVTLWLQANLRKEANLPAGKVDPTRGETQLGADAYAAAAGAIYMQKVLASSMAAGETEVIKDAIRALAGTAGSLSMLSGKDAPLVAALSYPDRRVRMMAADVICQARPLSNFSGANLVTAALNEAMRQSGYRTVVVVEPDSDTLNTYKGFVRGAGFKAIDGDSLATALAAIEQAGGAELIVLSMTVAGPDAEQALTMMRQNPLTMNLPVVIVSDQVSMVKAKRMDRNDDLSVIVKAEDISQASLTEALSAADLLALSGEAIEDAEAQQWMLTAAKDLRLLGLSRCDKVFDLVRCEAALAAGLMHENDQIKVACADALAVVPSGSAQQTICGQAATAESQDVRIKAYYSAAESVRNFGRQLTDSQAAMVIEVVRSTESPEIRNAASQLLGALNLPSEQIKDLILSGE